MLVKTDQTWLKNAEEVFRKCKDPVDFGRLLCKWEPHEGEIRWLRRPRAPRNNALITGRRWGKTECEAVDLLHKAIFQPNTNIGIVSITMDQARLCFDTAFNFVSNSPVLSSLVKRHKETPFPLLAFKTGSALQVRTAAREGIYIRGHKFDHVLVDEADYLPREVIDDVIRMCLADVGGPLTLTSTPRAKRGLVYELQRKYERKDPDVYCQAGASFENPHLDHAYIEGLRDKLTRDGWKREILGVYADDDAAVFRFEDIIECYKNNPTGAKDRGGNAYGVIVNEKPLKDHRYYAGWDIAKSIDHTVGFVVDTSDDKNRVVYMERTQKLPWPAITNRIQAVHEMYGCTESWYDSTGVGKYNEDMLNGFCRPFTFSKQTKIDLITSLQLQLEKRKLHFPFVRQVVDELQDYEWEDKNIPDTDCVMALALATWQGGGSGAYSVIPSLWN